MKNKGKKYAGIVSVLSTCVLFNIGCTVDPDWDDTHDYDYKKEIEDCQEISISTQKGLSLQSVNGRVKIQGSVQDTVAVIRIEKEVQADSQWEAEKYIEELNVHLSINDEAVHVETRHPSDNDVQFIVNLDIVIPEAFTVSVDHVNGDIALTAVKNNMDINLTNGDIQFSQCEASAWAGLTNGSILADLNLPKKGTCRFSIVNGDIALSVPGETSARLNASTVNGSISVSGLNLEEGEISSHSAGGRLGGGDGLIYLSVVNGSILVQKGEGL